MNDIVEDDFDLNHANIGTIKMPNRDGFHADPRPERSRSTQSHA